MSVALLAPAGFCMGMMFPLGMSASLRHRDLQPWFWSINGATSVFGSVLGTVISMEYGIAEAFWAGVGCYLLCLVLFSRLAALPKRAA
jgi:multidrug transporter EmrE-like cation transporter